VFSNLFTDAPSTDLEKVRLLNIAVGQMPPEQLGASPMPLRDIMLLVITPSAAQET
jgi:hypothetical protein